MNLYASLNLPEATLKLLAEKGGIKALADGDLAVENDNLEALRKVLKAAFPKDTQDVEPYKQWRHFERSRLHGTNWNNCSEPSCPSIPASILVKELEEKPFEWGEVVWFNDDNGWERGVYKGMTELKDVIQFYLPCAIRTNTGSNLDMVGVRHDAFNGVHEIVVLNGNMRHGMSFGDFKPILRKLSDMSEEERKEMCRIPSPPYTGDLEKEMFDNAAVIAYLIKQGFDLFGLIESGQAIDASTTKEGE